jgi:hypothetical protein
VFGRRSPLGCRLYTAGGPSADGAKTGAGRVLARFVEGEGPIDDTYEGNASHPDAILSWFNTDEDLRRVIGAWIDNRQYANVVSLWVKGAVIDWQRLYHPIRPRRIALPTYPFAQQRYWISDPVAVSDARGAPVSVTSGGRRAVVDHIAGFLAHSLGHPREHLDPDTDIQDYGADSITGALLLRHLEATLHVRVTGREIFEHRTIHALADCVTPRVAGASASDQPASRAGDDDDRDALERFKSGLLDLADLETLIDHGTVA